MNTNINKLFKKLGNCNSKADSVGLLSEEESWVVWTINTGVLLATLLSGGLLFLEGIGQSQTVGGIVLCVLIMLTFFGHESVHSSIHLLTVANVYSSVVFYDLIKVIGVPAIALWQVSCQVLVFRLVKRRIESSKSSKLRKKVFFPSISSCFMASFMGILFDMSWDSKLFSLLNIQAILFLTNQLQSIAFISRIYTDSLIEFFSGVVKGVSEGIFMTCNGKVVYHNEFFEKFSRNDNINWSERKSVTGEKLLQPVRDRNISTRSLMNALQPIREEESAGSCRRTTRLGSDGSKDSVMLEQNIFRQDSNVRSQFGEGSVGTAFEMKINENDIRVNSLTNMDIFLSVKYERDDLISALFAGEKDGLTIIAFLQKINYQINEENATFGPVMVYVPQEAEHDDSQTISSGDEDENILTKRFFQVRVSRYQSQFRRIIFTEIYIDDKKNPNIRYCTELAHSDTYSRIARNSIINRQTSSLSLNFKRSDIHEREIQFEHYLRNENSSVNTEQRNKTASMLHDFKNIAIEFSNISELLLSAKIKQEEGVRLAQFVKEYMLGLILHMTEYQKSGVFFSFIPGRELAEVPLNKLLKEMVAIFNTRQILDSDKSNLDISYLDAFESDVSVYSDKTLVMSLFYNIISNSYKYTEDGFIKVNCFEESEQLCVSVSDTGGGIPEEVLEKWGTAFNNIDSKKGSGLGSMIISSILSNLNIKMTHNIEKGVGTELILHFPREITPNLDLSRRTTRPLAGFRVLRPSTPTINSVSRRTKVAVIDDMPELANLVAKNIKDKVLIGSSKSSVSKFSSAKKFIEAMLKCLVEKDPFKIILIDQNLEQNLSGLELGSLIKTTYLTFKEEVDIMMISSDDLSGFLNDYRYPWLEPENMVGKTDFTSMNKRLTALLNL